MRRARDDAQGSRQGRIVLRRQKRGNQDEIGDVVANRLEGALGGIGQNQLGALYVSDDADQMGDLASVGFDGENQRHLITFGS